MVNVRSSTALLHRRFASDRYRSSCDRRRTTRRSVIASASEKKKKFDVLVIGGGPCGTETALICSMAGKTVAVADPRGALLGAPTGWCVLGLPW